VHLCTPAKIFPGVPFEEGGLIVGRTASAPLVIVSKLSRGEPWNRGIDELFNRKTQCQLFLWTGSRDAVTGEASGIARAAQVKQNYHRRHRARIMPS